MVQEAYVVMVGDRVRAVFIPSHDNGGDALGQAARFSAQMTASGADDPQDMARANGAWIARAEINSPA